MFYVKEPLTDTLEVHVEINDENVFCHCPVCGKEVQVNLEKILGSVEGDLCGTSVLCDACSRELLGVRHGSIYGDCSFVQVCRTLDLRGNHLSGDGTGDPVCTEKGKAHQIH